MRVLRLVAVDRLGRHAVAGELRHDPIGAVLGAREHERAPDRAVLEHPAEQRALVRLVDEHHPLLDQFGGRSDRVRLDLDRIAQDAAGQPHDLGQHGRREEQGLALLRQRRDHFPDIVDEAHVEHAVGLVEDEHLEPIEPHQRWPIRSSRRPGVAIRTSTPPRQRWNLLALTDAAEHHGVGELEKAAVSGKAVTDLGRQLTRRGQHQDAAGLRPGRADVARQAVQDRQGERRRLAGAGLRAAQQVAAGEEMGIALAWIGVGVV